MEKGSRTRKGTDCVTSCEAAASGSPRAKIILLASLFTLVTLTGSGWYGWQLCRQLKSNESEHHRIIKLNGAIIHLDEVLTMSARMSAATGDLAWEQRYRSFEPQLDAAIKEAMALAPQDFMSEAVAQTDAANAKLVAMENEAFHLVHDRNLETAVNLLRSQEYGEQKLVYNEGMKRYAVALEKYREAKSDKQRTMILGVTVFVSLVLLLAVFSGINALELRKRMSERKRAEQQREVLLHDMGDRIKELRCMYGVATSIREHETMEGILQDVVKLIPHGWHYPDITRARICFEGVEYVSEPFEETRWKQASNIVVDGRQCGIVEVYYIEEQPTLDEGPFLKEERQLIDGIALALSEAAERKQTEQSERLAYEKLEAAHEKVKGMQSQIVQSEKLASIGQLAAGVAHEMNTPVGFVASNFETLEKYVAKIKKLLGMYDELVNEIEDSGKTDLFKKAGIVAEGRRDMKIDFILEDIQELFDDSREGLARVTDIVQNLRDFSRIDQPGSLDEYDLNGGVEATLVVATNEIKYDADVKTEFSQVPMTCCNSGQINQVLLNILMNAVQAIRSQEREDRGTITLRTYATETAVVCEISDDGPGIESDKLSRIFEPFYTTKPAGEGTGLGLSVSYDIIVHKHNGKLLVESEKGKGTKFTIRLPITKKESSDGKEIESNGQTNSTICG